MCGIAGIFAFETGPSVELDELRAMSATLTHRGPDDEGHYVDAHARCGLAFRRLAVIDLETGNQPIVTEDGRVATVLNGEIYNFRALRDELSALGYRFRTSGDAEVIGIAYLEWGDAFVERLEGMFAIALWDRDLKRLLLMRDRVGKKPLHYAIHDERLLFGSELKAILALPEVPAEIDPASLHEYLLLQYVRAPLSIYHGFAKVMPGSMIAVGSTGQISQWRYWEPPLPQQAADKELLRTRDLVPRVRQTLRDAVERRLISDVPLGAFLSGGIDSSIIVALMRELGVYPLNTFSIGFNDPAYDESSYAAAVAKKFDTLHHPFTVQDDAVSGLADLVEYFDEPFADSSAIPTMVVSRQARQFVTVALTGDGGDELFLGYERYQAADIASAVEGASGKLIWRIARGLFPDGPPKSRRRKLRRFVEGLTLSEPRRYLSWVSLAPLAVLAANYRPEFREQIDIERPARWFTELYRKPQLVFQSRAAAFTDWHSYLPYDLLVKVDHASMSTGLECRSPFLDRELIELVLPNLVRVPERKRILRELAGELIDPQLFKRRKMGFGVPLGRWLAGPLAQELHRLASDSQTLSQQIFEPEFVTRLVSEQLSGRRDHGPLLWALIVLERWQERWGASLAL